MTTPETLSLARDSRRNARARWVWHGSDDRFPFWLECVLGVVAWCAVKVATALRVGEPKRKFRTCAMPRCGRVYYGVSELCRECRPQPVNRK